MPSECYHSLWNNKAAQCDHTKKKKTSIMAFFMIGTVLIFFDVSHVLLENRLEEKLGHVIYNGFREE